MAKVKDKDVSKQKAKAKPAQASTPDVDAAKLPEPPATAAAKGDRKGKKSKASSAEAGDKAPSTKDKAEVLKSKEVYRGKVFWVTHDKVREPGDVTATRDVVRHNGSVVILAVDTTSNPNDPGIVLIRQYRHAAEKFLLELPAGRIEPSEKLIPAAKRELAEETGYKAKRWSKYVTYYASPGFVSEAMNIILAEDLKLGEATPEEDERIEIQLTPLSEVMRKIHAGEIEDGKTLIGVLLYASRRAEAV